jgi:hypothetical protein
MGLGLRIYKGEVVCLESELFKRFLYEENRDFSSRNWFLGILYNR